MVTIREGDMLTSDSLPHEGVPRGSVRKHIWDRSRIFPDTTREYWIYVPAQYDRGAPASVMVFQDGGGYVDPTGPARVTTVFDNLIHKREMPVTIGIFINPGEREGFSAQRSIEYDSLGDTYARFLLEEILPEVGKGFNLTQDVAGRAICGISSGGICAFTVAWERPDAFSKVVSHVGSFTDIRGGHAYPSMIRKTRGNRKPIRVFLQDGLYDLNLEPGNWTLGNLQMESALMFARYDYRFVMGDGGHNLDHGGAMLPDTMRWLWRDHPGVKDTDSVYSNPESVLGEWDVVMNTWEGNTEALLNITRQGNEVFAVFTDKNSRDLEISNIEYRDSILIFDIAFPEPEADAGDVWMKATGGNLTMDVWAKVTNNQFKGALSSGQLDFSIKGRRKER